jgi:hypothetical protein
MIPEGVTRLEEGALSGLMAVQDIALPASLIDMNSGALPEGITLQRITVADGNPTFQSNDGVLFSKDEGRLSSFPRARAGNMIFHRVRPLSWRVRSVPILPL